MAGTYARTAAIVIGYWLGATEIRSINGGDLLMNVLRL